MLRHVEEMFVLVSQNNYLQRVIELQDIVLANMARRSREIRATTREKRKELCETRKLRIKNQSKEKREAAAITGYFYEFWRWIENKNKVKKNESIDGAVCLFEFWNSIQ